MRIFTLIDHYLPGYKGGGPIRSIASMVRQLPDLEFWIFTHDRDLGDSSPYAGITADSWACDEGAHVWYASPSHRGWRGIARALREARPDIVYSNSLFSRVSLRYVAGRLVGAWPRQPFILAPRGELSPGAMSLKRTKKSAFLRAARFARLFDDVVWHASTDLEAAEIRRELALHGIHAIEIQVAKNLFAESSRRRESTKQAGVARFVFVSRISRKKNLSFGIERLASLGPRASLSVYGPMEDPAYWRECAAAARRTGVRLEYRGAVAPELVPEVFASHDFFLFPTLGENFGHIIVEALGSGCPVVISDQTPWSGVQELDAGWAIPLQNVDAWESALSQCLAMTGEHHELLSRNACDAASALGRIEEARMRTRRMFEKVCSRSPSNASFERA